MWHWLLFFLCSLPRAEMEYITDHALSIAAMKSLVDMESFFIAELDKYSDDLEWKITTIESFLDEVQMRKAPWRNTPDEFVAHPLTSFSLVRRLHEDWSHMELFMSTRLGLNYLNKIQRVLDLAKPTEQDLHDALSGIDAIQNQYDLKATNMANGVLNGRQYNTNLTTLDCLAMVQFHENNKQMHASIDWNAAALQQYDEARDGHLYREVFNFSLSDLYGNYARSLTAKGLRQTALTLLKDVSHFHADLWQLQRDITNKMELHEHDDIQMKREQNTLLIGCLGLFPPIRNRSCHYESTRTAFLRLAPLKVELLSLDPYIAVYHDAIYDTEIRRVMTLPVHTLKGPPRYRDRREYNLKFTTVYEDANSQLNQRIRDMTGEEVKEDKDFSIYNYGIGGYIRYHVDNLPKEDLKPGFGDFQTTIIYFLNDVTHGGAISFPPLQMTVWPRKGSAVVWHNLDNNSQLDLRVAHISCPVIVGSKWTLVKWLHEGHQNFTQTPEKPRD
ncbi:prolyl 4-hydroxylase subunit alpha-2 [Drosophila obscura]|uniref:prolyl 4-hydroxylase subunit alpha-2 n=1 Tax=Drosophila obscura TaxID=7282 RepID=UPI001BB17396|nr:prolyl 4-hydroxylase subunit alpha-2 [Drosophila obscura]